MDYETLKKEISEIVSVVEAVPPKFQERCFDLLLTRLLARDTHGARSSDSVPQQQLEDAGVHTLPLKGAAKMFMQRTQVTEEILNDVLTYVDGTVEFLRSPVASNNSQAQIQWALLFALKRAIEEGGPLQFDAEAFRNFLDNLGHYDAGNYWKYFAGQKAQALFSRAVTSADPRQLLSADGQTRLGELLRQLAKV